MNLTQSGKIAVGLAKFLLAHPRQMSQLPRWLRQRSQSPVDLRVPWWPYDAAAWIARELPPGARVFEYGGGGSTLWLQDHGAVVTVVEHDPVWYEQLTEALPAGTRVLRRGTDAAGRITSQVDAGFFDSYVAAIDEEPDGSLDLVVVDGRARVDCVRRAMPKVKPGGLLILDDAARDRYRPAIDLLRRWQQNRFSGLKPGDPLPAQTSAWRRPA